MQITKPTNQAKTKQFVLNLRGFGDLVGKIGGLDRTFAKFPDQMPNPKRFGIENLVGNHTTC
jgi:hypothetical protein